MFSSEGGEIHATLQHSYIIPDRPDRKYADAAVMTRQARRPADNLRMMVMAAAMNPNADGSRAAKDGSEDDDRFNENDTSFGGRLIVTSFLSLPSITLNNWNDPAKTCLGHWSARPTAANGRGPTGIENQ